MEINPELEFTTKLSLVIMVRPAKAPNMEKYWIFDNLSSNEYLPIKVQATINVVE